MYDRKFEFDEWVFLFNLPKKNYPNDWFAINGLKVNKKASKHINRIKSFFNHDKIKKENIKIGLSWRLKNTDVLNLYKDKTKYPSSLMG